VGKTPREFLSTVSSSEITEIMAYLILQEHENERQSGQPAAPAALPAEDLDAKTRAFFSRPSA
jgi:hypothetical protein